MARSPGPMTGALAAQSLGVAPNTPAAELPPEAIEIGHTRAEVVREHGIDDPALLEEARRYGVSVDFGGLVTGTDEEKAKEREHRMGVVRARIARAKAAKEEPLTTLQPPTTPWWSVIASYITFERFMIVVLTMAVVYLLRRH